MAYEMTFAMLKPGVLQRRLAGEIIARIEKKGLQLVGVKMMQIDRNLAETHYAEHREKPFFGELTTYITSGPVLAMVIGGESAISMVRALCGATKAEQAAAGTIRGDYALVTGMNIIHASDSPESAKREIGLFFKENEILSYEDPNARWTY